VVVQWARAAAPSPELVRVPLPVPVQAQVLARTLAGWRSPAKEPPRLPPKDLNTIQNEMPAGEM